MKKLTLTLIAVIAVMAVACKPDEPAKVKVKSVELSLATVELTVEETQSLTATIEPADATDKTLTWSSSDESIATVDQSGKVTAVAVGTATITVKSTNDKSASCNVTVKAKEVPVESVSLDKAELSLVEEETANLTATITPTDATDKTLTWSSSDESIATVDQSGEVTAVAPGTATITAKSNNDKSASCNVTVSAKVIAVTSVSITSYQPVLANIGGLVTVKVETLPDNATNKELRWSVDDTEMIEFTLKGDTQCRFKPLKEGYATLTVTTEDGNKTATCVITVYNSTSGCKNFIVPPIAIPTRQIPTGTFLMGSPESDSDARDDEKPQHSVSLTKAFYMSKFETTNYQFAEFLNAKNVGSNGELNGNKLVEADEWGVQYNTTTSKWQAATGKEHYPVPYVTWYGASEFATWVGGRLPTEAEWEYACRAGATTIYPWGDTTTDIYKYAWHATGGRAVHPVGKKQPNAWGLYDMIGNVLEWCSDWYSSTYYTSTAQTDPTGPSSGSVRVKRGSFYGNSAETCRSAIRFYGYPTDYAPYCGFRVVFDN